MKSAVLFLVFNRPETTTRVFEAIRAARPPRLYVAADGPRATRQGEAKRCEAVRAIATTVDWPCELKTLFRDTNLGCRMGVSSGIKWFFEQEEEGIILEDDVLPISSFFTYCDDLLAHYRNDDRVAAVSGCNLVANQYCSPDSYFFSRYTHVWGWATWRRSWNHYDVEMTDWPAWDNQGGLDQEFSDRSAAAFWRYIFERVYRGHIDTWDYQWLFSCWKRGAVCALPGINQTYNLGFNADATHTTSDMPRYLLESQPRAMTFPLTHPGTVHRSLEADRAIYRIAFARSFYSKIKLALKRLVGALH